MIVVVCAWHRLYFARCRVLRIKFSGRLDISLSHGMCQACQARFTALDKPR